MSTNKIQISNIDNTLSIYKDNTVIIYGENDLIDQIVPLLQSHNIVITAICSTTIANIYNGINSITFEEFIKLDKNNVVVQLATTNIDLISKVTDISFLKIISFFEAMQVISFIDKLKMMKKFPQMATKLQKDNATLKANQTAKIQADIINSPHDELILLCLPPKTGDHTLMATFDKIGIPYHMLWHTPSMFDNDKFLKLNKTFKIITAIREPIARDLSSMYQGIEFIFSSPMIDKLNLQLKTPHIMSGGGDAQQIFDLVFNSKTGATPMYDFFNKFGCNIINIMDFPFDKELGYSIVKFENVEIFIFQLEKLDILKNPLGDFLGVSIDSYIIGNSTENKWINSSYIKAKENIKIDIDYFNKSYNSDWVKHFYSKDDINCFKQKWQKNIQKLKEC